MEKSATKARQIQALWPEIQAALENGQSLKSIRLWLEEEAGIPVSIASLTSYISRIRRREIQNCHEIRSAKPRAEFSIEKTTPAESAPSALRSARTSTNTAPTAKLRNDPLAQAMQALSKPKLDIREIHANGDPSGQNLI